ncbi:MAG: hypothetical protein H6553_09255 [Chitinophagales bacterium]|nr:hypothetical protein [Chitinophagales bacterium]
MKILKSFLLVLLPIFCIAQQQNLPLNYDWNNRVQRFIKPEAHFHTAIKPYNMQEVYQALDDVQNELALPDTNSTGFKFGLTKGDLVSLRAKKKPQFYFAVNPIIDAQFGYDIKEKNFQYSVGYGAQLNADLGRKVSLSFTYQGVNEDYYSRIKQYAQEYGVLTGYRKANINSNSINSNMMSGYLSFSPNKYFNLQVGNDKQFWGEGYRSFFLSDNASNYPYFRMSTQFWRIKYVYLLNVMRYGEADIFNIDNNPSNFKTKYGSYHYLSVDVAKWMQFGFFEGVTWYHADSNRTRGLEWNYLNPLLFIRPIEFGLGSPDNVILGFNFNFRPNPKNNLYIQVVLDDMDVAKARRGRGFYRTKVAAQFGYKALDIFKVKHLDVITEFNVVRPFVFAHKTPAQNYTNFNQSLTHPLGANFYEAILKINYWNKHWIASAQLQYAKQGLDALYQHNGSNIFVTDYLIASDLNAAYNNNFLQGIKTNLIALNVKGGYLINPKLNMSIQANINYRQHKNDVFKSQQTYFGLSFATDLFNRYTDF